MEMNNKLREAIENSNRLLEELAAIGERGESAREQIAENNAALASPATAEKSSVVDAKFELCNYPEQVLKIGRDFQNKDGFRGAHYDTVKLLCDTIEYQQEQLKTKIEVGDCAKLREAAVSVYNVLEKLRPFSLHLGDVGRMREFSHLICLAKNRLDAALAAPPRNCDVGTAEEQAKRLRGFCKEHRDGVRRCSRCPVERIFPKDCTLAWAQMPYEAKEEGGAK